MPKSCKSSLPGAEVVRGEVLEKCLRRSLIARLAQEPIRLYSYVLLRYSEYSCMYAFYKSDLRVVFLYVK
ncbi:hypothetical protein IMCC3135_13380 [Granulosicoccus antarcticus IMCC3135]|uniref:Uncharacterized protein n=1 Tax=Granulosicoccus antarcticus IMCC3135 TaxID=1192854 RepID=A0A2Z2NRY5_9GAMM|nr:hypothetical protein IMCC3135_13380 [Granulosicoccus antarcticus IMCC3135]